MAKRRTNTLDARNDTAPVLYDENGERLLSGDLLSKAINQANAVLPEPITTPKEAINAYNTATVDIPKRIPGDPLSDILLDHPFTKEEKELIRYCYIDIVKRGDIASILLLLRIDRKLSKLIKDEC